jgi:hypothetical protein
MELVTVYNALGRHGGCKHVANEALRGLARIGTGEHCCASGLKADRKAWERKRMDTGGHSAFRRYLYHDMVYPRYAYTVFIDSSASGLFQS